MSAAFAISTECAAAGTMLEAICSQAEACAGLEVAIGAGDGGAIVPANVTTSPGVVATVRDVADAAREHSTSIVNAHFHWPADVHLGCSDSDAAVRLLESAIHAAAELGAPTLSFAPAFVGPPAGAGYEDAYNNVYERLIELSFVAERANVVLGVVPAVGGFLLSPVETRDYVSRVNSPFVGAMLDVNAAAAVGVPEQWVRALGRFVVGVRVFIGDDANERVNVERIRAAMGEAGLDVPIIRAERGSWN